MFIIMYIGVKRTLKTSSKRQDLCSPTPELLFFLWKFAQVFKSYQGCLAGGLFKCKFFCATQGKLLGNSGNWQISLNQYSNNLHNTSKYNLSQFVYKLIGCVTPRLMDEGGRGQGRPRKTRVDVVRCRKSQECAENVHLT